MIWNWLKSLVAKPKTSSLYEALKPVKVVNYIPRSAEWIKAKIKMCCGDTEIHILDRYYHVQPKAVVEEWVKEFEPVRKYTEHIFDCDDFAFWFKAFMALKYGLNSVGYTEGYWYETLHAFNLIVCLDGVYLFEPQHPAKKLFPPEYPYTVRKVII